MSNIKRFGRFALKIHKAMPLKYKTDVYLTITDSPYYHEKEDYIALDPEFIKNEYDAACIALLHEWGHKILWADQLIETTNEDHQEYLKNNKITENHKTEECMAWVMAMQIYDCIKPRISKKKFREQIKRGLRTYRLRKITF